MATTDPDALQSCRSALLTARLDALTARPDWPVHGAPVQSSSPTCWPTRWRMPSGRPQRKAAERADENRGRPGAGRPGGRPRRQAQQSNTVSSLRARLEKHDSLHSRTDD